jgi:hemerythrin superfamily protein
MEVVFMTDALTLLKQDHRTVEELFDRFEHLHERRLEDGKKGLIEEITKELSIHSAIEEQVFYPAVQRALPKGDELADELRHEHQQVKELLAELEKMDPSSPQYDGRVHALIANVKHHVEEEEGEVFPKIGERLDQDTLSRLGEAMEKARKTAPTHPHPKAPSKPPANLIAGPPVAAIDRVRDAPRSRKVALLAVVAGVLGLVAWRVVRRSRD